MNKRPDNKEELYAEEQKRGRILRIRKEGQDG
jgi:hypothetical protein